MSESLLTAKPNMSLKLSRPQRIAVWSVVLGLWLSGALWLAAKWWLREQPELPGAAEAWLMRAHGLLVLPMLWLAGSLWTLHARLALHLNRNLKSGIALMVLWALLALSGYGLYYFAAEQLRIATSYAHWLLGLTALPALWLHRWFGKRSTLRT